MAKKKSLTARAVKQMLTRRGVDYSQLVITEESTTARVVDVHYSGPWQTYTQVRITAPHPLRDAADDALFHVPGLSHAPYLEYSIWHR